MPKTISHMRRRPTNAPVLDWAEGRKAYGKIGASRAERWSVASLDNTHAPATNDPSITGKRLHVPTQNDLSRILPLLTFPAPQLGKLKLDPALDYRPIAQTLSHSDPLKHDGVGGAASHYLQFTKVLTDTRDPQEEARAMLATALETVERGVDGHREVLPEGGFQVALASLSQMPQH
ncbi:hypothetical protein [Thioclava dalianensis]|uniref:hypothetical protein n=1 Tax=Thioclava dalianensis TaxID=1185766 RepID=UPI0011604FF7|nr:hypothetical protein [Thioclava dalianensis]